MDRPHEMLARLRITLEAGLPVADDVRQWLHAALLEYEESGEPLEVLLGLKGPGVATFRTQWQRGWRDELIAMIYSELEGTHWRRCEYIVALIHGEAHCPKSVREARDELRRMEVYVPRTTRGISDLLKRTPGITFQ